MEYMLVCADSQDLFTARVNKALGNGWSLQGGVSVAYDPSTGDRFFQAMVRDAVLGVLEVEAEAEDPLAVSD